MFDICVPTWNSLNYLKLLYKGIKRNTKIKYHFFVHDNDSEDGTAKWLSDNDITFTKSKKNLGFTGVNHSLLLGKNPYVIIVNSDMYPLPGWDIELYKEIKKFKDNKIDKFILSCSLIEPTGANPEYVISYHGHTYETFDEEGLLKDYLTNKNTKYVQYDTIQYSHPVLVPRKMLKDMNYLDDRYFPGWSVDHDIPAEAYKQGCRHYKMLTRSRMYHFISKTFSQLPNNIKDQHGEDIFEKKWKISVKSFRQKLKIAQPYEKVANDIIK